MNILAWYDAYVAQGLKIIPLRPEAKKAYWDWNKKIWDEDENRWVFIKKPTSNMGLVLGEIMDVEGDTVAANKRLLKLTANCPHPMYSSSKSIHHLFLNPDPSLSIIKFDGIEFRGKKHMSVLPPSRHEDGTQYMWMPESRFPIPKMPKSILHLLKQARRQGAGQKPGSQRIHCSKCCQEKTLHYKRLRLEIKAFKILEQKWECYQCRLVDIRPLCRELRKRGL